MAPATGPSIATPLISAPSATGGDVVDGGDVVVGIGEVVVGFGDFVVGCGDFLVGNVAVAVAFVAVALVRVAGDAPFGDDESGSRGEEVVAGEIGGVGLDR